MSNHPIDDLIHTPHLLRIADARDNVAAACRRIAERESGELAAVANVLADGYAVASYDIRNGASFTAVLYDPPDGNSVLLTLAALIAEEMESEASALYLRDVLTEDAVETAHLSYTFLWALAASLTRTACLPRVPDAPGQ